MVLLWRLAGPVAFLVSFACSVYANISIEEKVDYAYNIQPKLRIKGTGFSSIADPTSLDLTFLPKRSIGTDYTLEISGDTALVLTLQAGSAWIVLDDGSSPQPLFLSAVKVGEDSILDEPVQVATVLPTPTVQASKKNVFMGATPKIMVNGTNFNVKKTDLFFDPPLPEGITMSKKIISSTQILLTKTYSDVDKVVWCSEPGPLKVVAINTGGGRLPLNPGLNGVTIAEIQADLEGHGVTVASHQELSIYQSTPKLKIQGEGFLPGTKLRFDNAIRGGGTNFTISNIEPNELTLDLSEGSKWRMNVKSLPGALVLLSADAGDGWVPLGPTSAKAGRKVATVYEDPSVFASDETIFRTHSHELFIKGAGFAQSPVPVFVFDPPFDDGSFYTQVLKSDLLKLTLSSAWMAEGQTGDLKIKALDTGAGMVNLPEPVTVAKVVDDTTTHKSGVAVFPSNELALYQETSTELSIYGSGFKGTPKLTFEPKLSPGFYDLDVVSEDTLKLTLHEGKKWCLEGGTLLLMSIDVGDGEVSLAGGKGIKVAIVLNQPVVSEVDRQIYRSHTKRFPIIGSGFVSLLDYSMPPVIVLDKVPPSSYEIQPLWTPNVLTLKLLADQWVDVPPGGNTVIKIVSINTGAGVITFPDGGIEIATVQEDSTTALCEDSCIYADDGTCDEPSTGMSNYGYGSSSSSYGSWANRGWGLSDDANYYQLSDYSSPYQYAGYTTTFVYGSGYADDGMYMGSPPCEIGTDCTDCNVQMVTEGSCTNTCMYARDGMCDDPRLGGTCASGTDCQDCGPWGEAGSNFTYSPQYSSTAMWYNDDDNSFLLTDDMIAYGQEANEKPIYQRTWQDHTVEHKEAPGAGSIFMDVLWAMVFVIGLSVSLGICIVAVRHFKSGGAAPMYLPVEHAQQQQDEVEMASRQTGTTPDIVRIG